MRIKLKLLLVAGLISLSCVFFSTSRTFSAPLGPFLQVKYPQVKNTEYGPTLEIFSPTDLLVQFKENHAPVDMASLRITAKKGIFSKSLTDHLRPYIHEGILKVEGLEIPRSKFTLRVSIADINGAETVKKYRFIVN